MQLRCIEGTALGRIADARILAGEWLARVRLQYEVAALLAHVGRRRITVTDIRQSSVRSSTHFLRREKSSRRADGDQQCPHVTLLIPFTQPVLLRSGAII